MAQVKNKIKLNLNKNIWPRRVFIHIIQIVVMNEHILYNKFSKIGLDYTDFVWKLLDLLEN